VLSDEDEIRSAYNAKISSFSMDLRQAAYVTAKVRALQEAFSILSDPVKRSHYDSTRKQADLSSNRPLNTPPPPPPTIPDIAVALHQPQLPPASARLKYSAPAKNAALSKLMIIGVLIALTIISAILVYYSNKLIGKGDVIKNGANYVYSNTTELFGVNVNKTLASDGAQIQQNDAQVQFELAYKYYTGNGVREDKAVAVHWYEKAANQGHAAAAGFLGQIYLTGEGMPRNKTKALEWFKKAADQGDAQAQFDLGHMYDTGDGLAENDSIAVQWYRKAAYRGHYQAQLNLGNINDQGTERRAAMVSTKAD
jgi:TPR repeat protein